MRSLYSAVVMFGPIPLESANDLCNRGCDDTANDDDILITGTMAKDLRYAKSCATKSFIAYTQRWMKVTPMLAPWFRFGPG